MKPLIEKYRSYLSVGQRTTVISLNEGNTPLLFAPRLSKEIGAEIYLKLEGLNPTGSFKDRGMTMAVSKAVEGGAKAIVCASTGNTSASAAAYAARAGLRCIVLIPEGKVAQGKLAQVSLTGAEVIQLDGNFDEALNLVRELSDKYPIELVNSVNPFRIEGQTTGSFEIVDELGSAPDYHALPVGNAGNITAYWRGYNVYHQEKNSGLPKMIGFQAAGAAPIVLGHPVANPETVATAIRIGNPASWRTAEKARDESGGRIDLVTDEEILEAYRMLCSYEGVFCEPASASSLAGVLKMVRQGFTFNGKKVVCILTGNGLKDPTTAISFAKEPVKCASKFDALVALVGAH